MSKILNVYKILFAEFGIWLKGFVKNWRINLRNLFLKNLREKFIAILLAVLTYGYVRYQDVEQRNLFVPLEIIKNEELTFVNDLPKTVSLFVSGNKSALNDLDVNKIVARIDMSDISAPGVFQRSPILETVPDGIQIIRMNPQNLVIELSNLDRKIISIEPILVGIPKSGFLVEGIETNPSRIWVFGPRDILQDITRIPTETINIDKLDVDKLVSVGFSKNVHPALNFERDRKIEVSINIESVYSQQTLGNPIPVSVMVTNNLVVEQSLVVSNVSYKILKRDLDGFDIKEDLLFTVDATKITEPGDYRLPVRLTRKKGITSVIYQPRFMNITLKRPSVELDQQK